MAAKRENKNRDPAFGRDRRNFAVWLLWCGLAGPWQGCNSPTQAPCLPASDSLASGTNKIIPWQIHDALVTVWPNHPRPEKVAHSWGRSSGKPPSQKMTFRSVCEMPAKQPPNRPANRDAILISPGKSGDFLPTFAQPLTGRVRRLPANICEACQRPPPRQEIVNFDQKWQKKIRGGSAPPNPPVTKLDISIRMKRTRKFVFPW